MSVGQLVVVLNAHLPFVRHPGAENVPQEYWLYQAITESYIPLLDVLGTLDDPDGIEGPIAHRQTGRVGLNVSDVPKQAVRPLARRDGLDE